MAQFGHLRLGTRQHEGLAREDKRGKNHYPAAQAKDAEAWDDQHFQEQAKQAAREQQHLQPAGRAVQEITPKEQEKRQGSDESTGARARRVELDVDADEAD